VDTSATISQSYDDLTEHIEQALRISSSGLSTNCNVDQSLVGAAIFILTSCEKSFALLFSV